MQTGMGIDDVLKFSVECAGDQLDLNLMDEELNFYPETKKMIEINLKGELFCEI